MKEILNLLPDEVAKTITDLSSTGQIYELRLHAGHPPILISSKNYFQVLNLPQITKEDIEEIVLKACSYSLYAFEKELNQGFITIAGNHRIGLCGSAVTDSKGEFCSLINWSGLNIRFATKDQVLYCNTVQKIAAEPLFHTLIAGPPACGKTTLLRRIASAISKNYKVAVIDEREELTSSELGPGSFVYRKIDKATGSALAIRSMSPQFIIFDEIASEGDRQTIQNCSRSGCIVYASIHKTQNYSATSLFEQNSWCDRVIVFTDTFETKEYLRD